MAISAKTIMNDLARSSNLLKEVAGDDRKNLQLTLVTMMQDIHNVCEKYHIGYSLVGGSCLGAIRHQGFIPWDDDIDIAMLREDWEKFKSFFEDELGDKYVMEAPRFGNKDCKTTWAKVYKKGTVLEEIQDGSVPFEKGVFIDIFFYENVSDNKWVRTFDAVMSDFLKGVATSIIYYKYPNELIKKFYDATPETRRYYRMRRCLGFLFSFVSHKNFCALYDRFVSRHKRSSILMTIPTGRKNYKGETIQRSLWEPLQLAKFENAKFYVLADSHGYLKTLYGDNYMQLPPEEKRERHFVVRLELDSCKN